MSAYKKSPFAPEIVVTFKSVIISQLFSFLVKLTSGLRGSVELECWNLDKYTGNRSETILSACVNMLHVDHNLKIAGLWKKTWKSSGGEKKKAVLFTQVKGMKLEVLDGFTHSPNEDSHRSAHSAAVPVMRGVIHPGGVHSSERGDTLPGWQPVKLSAWQFPPYVNRDEQSSRHKDLQGYVRVERERLEPQDSPTGNDGALKALKVIDQKEHIIVSLSPPVSWCRSKTR